MKDAGQNRLERTQTTQGAQGGEFFQYLAQQADRIKIGETSDEQRGHFLTPSKLLRREANLQYLAK